MLKRLPQLAESEVILGSCYEELERLPTGQLQCVFVDPPYNFGFDYGGGKAKDSLPADVYLGQMRELIEGCVALLNDTGSLWFLVPECWADQIGRMLSANLPRRNRVIWRETFGQYHESKFPGGHRHLFWHVKDAKKTPFYTDDIRVPSQRMIDGDKRAAGPRVPDDSWETHWETQEEEFSSKNVWKIPRLVGNARDRIEGHPCQLPEDLLERVIKCSTKLGDWILDPMAGSGTTLRVAQRLERNYVGIEQNADFVQIIHDRLSGAIQKELF